MKLLDRMIQIVSWLTLAGLCALAVLRHIGVFAPPVWFTNWAMPILTAAAVGYLTNWIAIWLLFKPYNRHCGFIQGVIPCNRAKMGRELGVIIPEYLIKPDELADQLSGMVRDYLQNPAIIDDIRSKVNVLLKKYGGAIASFLIPYVEDGLKIAIQENLTPDKLCTFFDHVVLRYLGDEGNRKFLAESIAGELQRRAPEFNDFIRDAVRLGAKEYVKAEYPRFAGWFNMDDFAARLVDSLNWDRIQSQIAARLGEPATQVAIGDELGEMAVRIQSWLKSPAAAEKINAAVAENRLKTEAYIRLYLETNIPGMVEQWFLQDALWNAVGQQLLPLIQSYLLHRLKHDKESIVRRFDLPGRIERSVAEMDMATLHRMLTRASGEHLTAIQLLGYFLGGLAGLLLIFST